MVNYAGAYDVGRAVGRDELIREMLSVIDRQMAGTHTRMWILSPQGNSLSKVRTFVESFKAGGSAS